MQLQPLRALKSFFAVATLALVVGGAALAGGTGVASAEETCVDTAFGTTVCTESFVLDVQTYSVEGRVFSPAKRAIRNNRPSSRSSRSTLTR